MYASVKTRRDFLKSVGLGTASLFLPGYGNSGLPTSLLAVPEFYGCVKNASPKSA